MKKQFFKKLTALIALALLTLTHLASGQAPFRVKPDTVMVVGAELQVQNASKNVPGFLYNQGDGKTVFKKLTLENIGDSAIAIAGQDTIPVRFSGGGGGSVSVPPVSLAALSTGSNSMQLKWWQSDRELYQSPKIALIGDSQGAGRYASTPARSLAGRLQAYIYAVSSNARLINYCKDGYNSRNLAPTGSNSFVDPTVNVTKAIADGNNIIILINTSNDYAYQASGGEMSTEEALSNTLLIEEACKKAGVQLLVMSSIPRTAFGPSQRLKLRQSADNLRKTFGPRCIYAYHLLEDPANPDALQPSLQYGDNIHLNDEGYLVMFNAMRNTLAGYFTSNTDVVKYIVQRSAYINGTYNDFQTITTPAENVLGVSPDGSFYRVRIYFRDGYFSGWSNVAKAIVDDTSPGAQLPTVSVGGPVTIVLPVDNVSLSATAAAQNGGSISSYMWTKVSGGAATITQPSSSTTTVTALAQGSYVFRCTVTDNKGVSNSADKSVSVLPVQDAAGASKFNFNFSPQNIGGWVDVSGGPLNGANNGKSWTDSNTGIGITCVSNSSTIWGASFDASQNNSSNTNGEKTADAGGFATDPQVISSAWYSNKVSYANDGSNQLKITGLNPAKKYLLKFYCSLDNEFGLNATPTVVIINNNTFNKREVAATGNTSQVAVFKGVKPDASGQVPVFIGCPSGGQSFGMINGLSIVEDNTTTNNPPVLDLGPDQRLSQPVSTTQLKATITDADNEPVSVSWTKVSGPSATITSPASISTTVTGLQLGTYVFRCTVTDKSNLNGSKDITVTVLAANSFPKIKVAFSKTSFTESGWQVLTGEPATTPITGSATFEGNTIGIKVGNWSPFAGNASADATGETVDDGGGFAAPARVVKGNLFNTNTYNAASSQLQLTNLPQGTYMITLLGSVSNAVANGMPGGAISCFTEYRVNSEPVVVVDNKGNTSKTAVFSNIVVAANGAINVYINPVAGELNKVVGSLCYFILEKTD